MRLRLRSFLVSGEEMGSAASFEVWGSGCGDLSLGFMHQGFFEFVNGLKSTDIPPEAFENQFLGTVAGVSGFGIQGQGI